jgi:hypothetical protein
MAASDQERELAEHTGALCALLNERALLRHPEVREAAEHVRSLLAAHPDRDQLAAAFTRLDEALRRAGDARGLRGRSRGGGATAPAGIRRVIKVARCPGAVLCTRREPAPDLRPLPRCAVNGVRMRREQLGREP